MFVRRIAATAALALLPLAPAGLAHAATQASTSGNHVTHIRTNGPLDTDQPALATNGCWHNDAYEWVTAAVDIDVAGPVATAAQKAWPGGRWKANLVYASHGRVRARIPITGNYYGKWAGYENEVEFEPSCRVFTRLAHAGFGSGGVSTDRFRLTGVTATIKGRTYAVGASPVLRQRVRPMYRAVLRTWHRSGNRVKVVGAAQRWVRRGRHFQWRNTRAGVPVLIDTSCRTKTQVRRTGPRGRFVFRTTRARFRDHFSHPKPMVETEIRNTRTRSGDVDGWWWRPGKHRFGETAWGLYCEND